MTSIIEAPTTVRATLNFAAERKQGLIWSNYSPEMRTLQLQSHTVELRDARSLPSPARLEDEGFEVHRLPLEAPEWTSEAYLNEVYTPKVLDLIARRTGAAQVLTFRGNLLIRDTGDPKRASAAEFVHLDRTYASCRKLIEANVAPEIRERYGRVAMINVWRPLTPPPQDVPLALCDQRTVDKGDWVIGLTREANMAEGVENLTAVFNPANRWYYVSDLRLDEMVVFKGYDSDETVPMGCLHGAFKHPHVRGAVPRASVELRVYAFYDA
jgi:hypothetical protein